MFGPVWMRWGLALPLLTLNLFVLRQLLVPLAPFPGLFPMASCKGASGLACDFLGFFGCRRNLGDLRDHVGSSSD
jgi:hypothetical protein